MSADGPECIFLGATPRENMLALKSYVGVAHWSTGRAWLKGLCYMARQGIAFVGKLDNVVRTDAVVETGESFVVYKYPDKRL